MLFASGGTGLSIFESDAIDDPGALLAMAAAIAIAASLEDIIVNGTDAAERVEVHIGFTLCSHL